MQSDFKSQIFTSNLTLFLEKQNIKKNKTKHKNHQSSLLWSNTSAQNSVHV